MLDNANTLARENTVHGDEMYGKIFEVYQKDYITSEGVQTGMMLTSMTTSYPQ